MRKTLERDLDMIGMLSRSKKEVVALHYGKLLGWESGDETNNLNQWLYRIRNRRADFREYINRVLSLEKRNPRLKKILLSASENDLDLIEDETSL